MNKPDTKSPLRRGLKPLILAWIIPVFLVGSVISVFSNYIMARRNDEKRIRDHIVQRRMDLVFLSNLPSLHMYLMNLKLGLFEEAAFVKEDVQLYNVNYLKNLQPSFPHILSVISLQGEELLRIEEGEVKQPHEDFSASSYLRVIKASEFGKPLPLPLSGTQVCQGSRVVDVYPVFSEINNMVIGGLVYDYRIPFEELTQHSRQALLFNIVLGAASVLAALSIINVLLDIITKPLNNLTKASQDMLAGNLSGRIEIEGLGETRTLASAFESLRQRLQKHIQELESNARELETIIDFLPDATLIIDTEKRVLFWNKAMEEMTGYSREDMIGKGDMEYALPFYGQKHPILINLVFNRLADKDESPEKGSNGIRYFDLRQEGNVIRGSAWCSTVKGVNRLLSATACALYDDRGNISGAIECIRDITDNYTVEQEKKQLQAQLLHAQKMEAVGTLAGGIAHDFNNRLQTIYGYTELLLMDCEPSLPAYKRLEAIEKSAQRAGELVKQLLIFSSKNISKLRPLDLNSEVRQIHQILQRTIPKMIDIELHLAENLSTIDADAHQIEQVIMNLAINARDAMPDGGRLTIETANVGLDEKFCHAHPALSPGKYVLLGATDTGRGMDDKTRERIFEPFFTTKEVGKGTGLGLAMVYGIVKNHTGLIECGSELGKGTTFRIYLPASPNASHASSEKVGSQEKFQGGKETVLLVDDEELVREYGEELLRMYGYKVLTATDAESALNLYREKKEQIDLVILDMIMPGMGGNKCLEELRKVNSRIKIVVASGYSIMDQPEGVANSESVEYIKKPYQAKEMLNLVRNILDRD